MSKHRIPTPVHHTAKVILRTGLVLGQLTTLARVPSTGSGQHDKWRCQCACGNETLVRSSYLVSGKTTSCGCARKKKAAQQGGKREGAGRPEGSTKGTTKVQKSIYIEAAAAAVADHVATLRDISFSEAVEFVLLHTNPAALAPVK